MIVSLFSRVPVMVHAGSTAQDLHMKKGYCWTWQIKATAFMEVRGSLYENSNKREDANEHMTPMGLSTQAIKTYVLSKSHVGRVHFRIHPFLPIILC